MVSGKFESVCHLKLLKWDIWVINRSNTVLKISFFFFFWICWNDNLNYLKRKRAERSEYVYTCIVNGHVALVSRYHRLYRRSFVQ